MRYPVLVVQNEPAPNLGVLGEALAARGMNADVRAVWRGDRVPSTISGYRDLVVLGGPQSAWEIDRFPYLAEEARAIREAVATRTPVLGICLGAQLVAHALGGRAFRGPAPERGWRPVRLTPEARTDVVFRHFPSELTVFESHADTFDLPAGAVRLAGNEAYANQAFALPNHAYGVQFHLDWDEDIVRGVVEDAVLEDPSWAFEGAAALAETPARLAVARRAALDAFGAFLDGCGCND